MTCIVLRYFVSGGCVALGASHLPAIQRQKPLPGPGFGAPIAAHPTRLLTLGSDYKS